MNKVIAFYLPQFHPIPENDAAHGEGFTEWTNTRKAKPLFEGHYQPRTPWDENYYSLLDPAVMEEQAKLAKEYGVYGFCYYHYWFSGGRKLLEQPVEAMLHNPAVDIPFCLCWANENWSKRWDGGNDELIVAQDYGDLSEVDAHMDYLCEYFRDERYITVDGAPLLLIYKPDLIPHLRRYVNRMRSRARVNGFPEIKLAVQYPKYYCEGVGLDLFDYYVQFQPRFVPEYELTAGLKPITRLVKRFMIRLGLREVGKLLRAKLGKDGAAVAATELTHRDYDKDWESILQYPVKDKRLMAGAFVDWDNTSRNTKGLVYDGTTPEKFGHYMTRLMRKVDTEYSTPLVFINAWNEWAEGAYLEPDMRYGYEYLEQLLKAVQDTSRCK